MDRRVLKGRRNEPVKEMPQSLHSNFASIIFSTKHREPMLTGDIATKVYSYMAGIVKDMTERKVAASLQDAK